MKFAKIIAGIPVLYFLFLLSSVPFVSCQKTAVHDTTTITRHDTTVIKDTVTIVDTLGNLSNGLVAYYNFNNGNLNDSSGNGNNIIFNNATPTVDRFGNSNNAYLFDGSSSYMQVKNSASLNPNNITMFAIVKPNGFFQGSCHGNQIIEKGYPYQINGFYGLEFLPNSNGVGNPCAPNVDTTTETFSGIYGDNTQFGYAAPNSPGVGATAGNDTIYVQTNQWSTIAFTYDGTTARFYLNGALINSVTKTVPFTPNSYDLFIGASGYFNVFPFFFNGKIDEIRIYNKAISNQQVGYLNILKTKYLKVGNKIVY